LFLAHGFDNVTVAQITERAGLTRRTFSRYFTDKRDVLFAGSEQLPRVLAAAVGRADPDLAWAEQPERASLADRIRETAAELAATMQPAAPPSDRSRVP
jgi:AcrR family transcriptional regulator